MRLTTIAIFGILFGILSVLPFTAFGGQNAGGVTIESYQKAIGETRDATEEALLRKKLGDVYVLKEDYKKAAGEFIRALSLKPSAFSAQDRVQMAVYLSWADRLDDSVKALRDVLVEDPVNHKARTELSKVLSWSDKLEEAGAEADRVLNDEPNNQEVLIVKANVLRWQGDAPASIPIYEKAIQQGERFDARLGIAYAYLDAGDQKRAGESAAMLKPRYPYQEKELQKLGDAFCSMKASYPILQYSYYHDSDDNRVNRYTLSYVFRTRLGDAGISHRLTDAKDPAQSRTARDLFVTTTARWRSIDASMALGITTPAGSAGGIAAGTARVDKQAGWGTIGISLSREMMTDTAALIENRIVRTGGAISLGQNITQRLSLSESYAHTSFSDSNHSDNILIGARYALTLASPRIAAGYRFRSWNFERQSNGGYFDPNNFTSHQIYLSLYAEQGGWYASLEPYAGLQSFTRNDEYSSHSFYGAVASTGWTIKKCTAFEINGEGGNYAGGTASGFNYYQVGFRLKVYF